MNYISFTVGNNYNFNDLVQNLIDNGYLRVNLVVDRGEIAVRGDLVDIYPADHNTPIRLEFFDNTLESIRTFNIVTQLSISEIKSTKVAQYKSESHLLIRSNDFLEQEDHLLPEFSLGDFIVHENYGVARFNGLIHLREGSVEGEYFHLQYAGSETIYIPIDQSHLIHRYSGGDITPQLSSLSGGAWQQSKKRAKAAAKNIAFDLFNLYRKRELTSGYRFGEDTEWQLQVEQLFPYRETADQLQAIADVKKDMESVKPMDRLVCGEVGFGKTEIAIRAAFKAAIEGKQVAFIAPTTILVYQHYRGLTERFKEFGLTVGMLSSFYTVAQNKKTVDDLKKGKVNVVVGTHRLLQKDVGFKDLGLVIIDEEQRFGVEHKEFFKNIFTGVDILTLSATPIPRTLYMTLSGVRDISILHTAPEKRHPIKTYLAEYEDKLIKEAIDYEINRGGQVYFLNNDIKSLPRLRSNIKKILPDARVAIAHGRIPKQELEQIIIDFTDKKFDILLCTTIIENGIDIANANTIIINQADHFGLSQLHQIRGRVGRSQREAYAYLLYQKNKVLSSMASERLHTLKEFTALGVGYRIAMKDLELRGAGNILGGEQSGFAHSIGYTLYYKILEESVRELKGETITAQESYTLPSNQENYIPANYMEEESLRISFYRRIMEVKGEEELSTIERELKDRFGVIPEATKNLMTNVRYQIQRKNKKVKKVFVHPRYKGTKQ